jgi:hypothetical protein
METHATKIGYLELEITTFEEIKDFGYSDFFMHVKKQQKRIPNVRDNVKLYRVKTTNICLHAPKILDNKGTSLITNTYIYFLQYIFLQKYIKLVIFGPIKEMPMPKVFF